MPSGVRAMRPLIAYFTPTVSSPTISGMSASASSIWGSKSSAVNGNSVGDSAASAIDGISSGSWRIERWAYEPISSPIPSWRSYMRTSMSRTIGNSMARDVFAKRGTGPTSIIWWTAGVRGIRAPAISAIIGDQTPQAMTTYAAATVPWSVSTVRMRPPSTPKPVTSVFAEIVRAPRAVARSRQSVPNWSESQTPTPGVWKPPTRIDSSMNGTSSLTSAGVRSRDSIPQFVAESIRRRSSFMRVSVRATSMPPHSVYNPHSRYCRALSRVSSAISLLWSTRNRKFEA